MPNFFQSQRSFCQSLYRGQFNPPTAFFGFFVFGSLLVGATIFLLAYAAVRFGLLPLNIALHPGTILFINILPLPYVFFAGIGTWRSLGQLRRFHLGRTLGRFVVFIVFIWVIMNFIFHIIMCFKS